MKNSFFKQYIVGGGIQLSLEDGTRKREKHANLNRSWWVVGWYLGVFCSFTLQQPFIQPLVQYVNLQGSDFKSQNLEVNLHDELLQHYLLKTIR